MSTATPRRAQLPIPDPIEVPWMPIPDAGRLFGMSRVASYRAAKDGFLPTVALSEKRRVVPTAELRRMLGMDPGSAEAV